LSNSSKELKVEEGQNLLEGYGENYEIIAKDALFRIKVMKQTKEGKYWCIRLMDTQATEVARIYIVERSKISLCGI